MKIILYNILWCYIVVCYPGESVILSTECFKFIACCWEESAQCGQLRSHCGCEAPRMEENKFATACIYWNSLLQNIFITWRAAVQKPLHISLFPCLRTACLSTHKLQCSMERGEASLSAISVGWRARFLPLRDNTYHFFLFQKIADNARRLIHPVDKHVNGSRSSLIGDQMSQFQNKASAMGGVMIDFQKG